MKDQSEAEASIAHALEHGVPGKGFADGWFKVHIQNMLYEDAMHELLWSMVGQDSWQELTTDYYDASFEIHECDDVLAFTAEQQSRFWDLGFQRCWINHKDGTETYYWKGGNPTGHRKQGLRSQIAAGK